MSEPKEERGVYTHDFRDEAQLMAGTNARLCSIVEAADVLQRAVQLLLLAPHRNSSVARERVKQALEGYIAKRLGS